MAVETTVDVRPGPIAAFDGDRLQFTIRITNGEEHHRFERDELPAIEETITVLLEGSGSGAVRFGDRAACRGVLPAATLDAIERRLLAAARHEDGTLVTWTAAHPKEGLRYDAVIE